jgi:[acyl-carrier-protein] S-malonyltransferase
MFSAPRRGPAYSVKCHLVSKSFAALFPGQGSQKAGMGKDLHDAFEPASKVFTEVTEATGVDVRDLCFEADESTLKETQNTQIALFTVSVAAWRAFHETLGVKPSVTAGHSVGEYAALVCAEVLELRDGARLVRKRGELMRDAGIERPGGMAAVMGFDSDDVLAFACQELASDQGRLVVANYNCPGQTVISGDEHLIEEATKRPGFGGAKRIIKLNVSGAFHSPLMMDAANKFAEFLQRVTFYNPSTPIISNVTAEVVSSGAEWRLLLAQQIASPVLWSKSLQTMYQMGPELYIEFGGGEVLLNFARRTLNAVDIRSVSNPVDIYGLAEALI